MEYFEPINETSYLAVPNAPVYRKLCGVFTVNMRRCISRYIKKIYTRCLSRIRRSRIIPWNS